MHTALGVADLSGSITAACCH